jgi:hypothetical protein
MIMSGTYNKKQPRSFNPRPPQQAQASQPQVEELEEEAKWNPTPEQFQAFFVRDEQLATGNILMVLSSPGTSLNVKGLKDCTLHSSDCIERVLAKLVTSGQVTENKGRYARTARAVLAR